MPKATQFVVTVPAGTQSATGNELKDATQWRFSTSGPHIEWHFVGVRDDMLRPLTDALFYSFSDKYFQSFYFGESQKSLKNLDLFSVYSVCSVVSYSEILYLVNYEHTCTEQLSSEILGVVVLRDMLSAFQSRDFPDPKTFDSNVAESLNKFTSQQLGTGGFCLWDSGNDDFPFASIQALHGVAKAEEMYAPETFGRGQTDVIVIKAE